MGDKLGEILDKAREYVALAEISEALVREAAEQVAEGFQKLSEQEAEDISDLLTGNPIADRARLETSGVAAEINASIAWDEVPAEAFRLARMGLDLFLLLKLAF